MAMVWVVGPYVSTMFLVFAMGDRGFIAVNLTAHRHELIKPSPEQAP